MRNEPSSYVDDSHAMVFFLSMSYEGNEWSSAQSMELEHPPSCGFVATDDMTIIFIDRTVSCASIFFAKDTLLPTSFRA